MLIVFMGTPDFAVPSLRRLLADGHSIPAVITRPDLPRGRGRKRKPTPVKEAALEAGLKVLQPSNLNDESFRGQLAAFRADCFVVVAFRILPPSIYTLPNYGAFNLHASLLPKYRGAAPIQWALIQGEKETGVTTFFLREKVDTGPIILQERLHIHEGETAGELHDRLALLGAEVVSRTAMLIEQGRVKEKAQNGKPTRAPKLTPSLFRIDWNRPAEEIVNLIRGLSPSPGAVTEWRGARLKLTRAAVAPSLESRYAAGEILLPRPDRILVQAGQDMVELLELQQQGKKRLAVPAFLRGSDLHTGEQFS